MGEKNYNKILTIVLIITAVLAVGVVGFFGYDVYKKHAINKGANEAINEFTDELVRVRKNTNSMNDNQIGNQNNVQLDIGNLTEVAEGTESNSNIATKTYKGFTMNGIIEIPSINLKYPVLDRATKTSMEVSVGIAYGPGLNQVGNTVIMGHNYRNGTFFSNLEKVKMNDIIYITDNTGKKLKYTVYNIYTTASEDFEYASRDTAGKREISLSTCTDDVKNRIIIWAKE